MSETGTGLAVPMTPAQAELEGYKETVRMIADTDFVPKQYRGNKHAILAAILYGREVGLEPMESLGEIHMIEGRPTLSAKAMLKLARRNGHTINGEADEKKATVTGKRGDDGSEMTVSYTLEQATRAGLASRDNWKKHAEDMLWARAVSRLCRRLFTDVFGALPYGPEEVESVAYAHATTDDERETIAATDDLPLIEDNPIEGEVVNSVEAEISEQEQLGSEFVRMAQDAQSKKQETGE